MTIKTKSANFRAPRDAAHTAQHTTEGATLASLYIVNGNGCKHYPEKLPVWKIADALLYAISYHFEHTEGAPKLTPYSAARLRATLQQAADDLGSGAIADLQIAFAEQWEGDEIGMRLFGATVPPTIDDSYYPSTLMLAIGPMGELSQRQVQPSINSVMRRHKAFGGRGYVFQ